MNHSVSLKVINFSRTRTFIDSPKVGRGDGSQTPTRSEKEQELKQKMHEKQREVYECFKDTLKINTSHADIDAQAKEKFGRLFNQLTMRNNEQTEELKKLRGESEKINFLPRNQEGLPLSSSFEIEQEKEFGDNKNDAFSSKMQIFGSKEISNLSQIKSVQLKQQQNQLQAYIEDSKQEEEKVSRQIILQEDAHCTLEQKINQIQFSIDKIKRDMKDVEIENTIVEKKNIKIADRGILAHKKKNIVKISLANFKQEVEDSKTRTNMFLLQKQDIRNSICSEIKTEQEMHSLVLIQIDKSKQEIEEQEKVIAQLDAVRIQLDEKQRISQEIASYLDTINDLKKLVDQGEVEKFNSKKKKRPNEQRRQSEKPKVNKIESLNKSCFQSLPRRESNDHSQQSGRNYSHRALESRQSEIISLTAQNQEGSPSQKQKNKLKFQKLVVQKEFQEEIDRKQLVKKSDLFINQHGTGPNEVVEYLLKKFKENNFSLESNKNQFEELTCNKSSKAIELSNLEKQIEAIDTSTFQKGEDLYEQSRNKTQESSFQSITIDKKDDKVAADTNSTPKNNILKNELEKILTGFPMSIDAFKRGLEREQRECEKLQESLMSKISIQAKLIFNMVEVLFRYNCLLKLAIEQLKNNNCKNSNLFMFSEEFSKFICTFRLGLFPKRQIAIDQERNSSDAFSVIKKEISPRAVTVECRAKEMSPLISQSNQFQFNDTLVEFKSSLESKQDMEQDANKSIKFLEKMNFIPFNIEELIKIYKQVFPKATKYFLKEWCSIIKGSLIQFYIKEEGLIEYLQEVKQAERQKNADIWRQQECSEEDIEQNLMIKSFSDINKLYTKSYTLHFQHIKKIFDCFEQFTTFIQKGKKELIDKYFGGNPLSSFEQIEPIIAQKGYSSMVVAKRDRYLNFQGEQTEPITEKKSVTMKNLKDTAKENASREDLKNLIFKLAKNEKKGKIMESSSKDRLDKANRSQSCQDDELDLLDPNIKLQLKQQQMNEFEYLDFERLREKKLLKERARQRSIEQQLELETKKKISQTSLMQQHLPENHYRKNTHFYKQEDKSHKIYSEMIEQDKVIWKLQQLEKKKDYFTNSNAFIKIKPHSPKTLEDFSLSNPNLFSTPRSKHIPMFAFSSSTASTSRLDILSSLPKYHLDPGHSLFKQQMSKQSSTSSKIIKNLTSNHSTADLTNVKSSLKQSREKDRKYSKTLRGSFEQSPDNGESLIVKQSLQSIIIPIQPDNNNNSSQPSKTTVFKSRTLSPSQKTALVSPKKQPFKTSQQQCRSVSNKKRISNKISLPLRQNKPPTSSPQEYIRSGSFKTERRASTNELSQRYFQRGIDSCITPSRIDDFVDISSQYNSQNSISALHFGFMSPYSISQVNEQEESKIPSILIKKRFQ